jgi:hypothetical protein
MTIGHSDIQARIAATWLDIIPSRRKLAKRSLPPQAHECTPNVLVVALPTDKSNLDLCGQFRLRHWKPGFDMAHIPSDFVWQIVTPGGQRLMLFTWTNWRRNSRKLFEDFCRETGRKFGTLTLDGAAIVGAETIPLGSCRLVHETELRARPALVVKAKSAKVLASKAEQFLKRRTGHFEAIDYREFHDEPEAHDDRMQESVEQMFRVNFAKYESALTDKYGSPTKGGSKGHRDIPINGVMQYQIWRVGSKSLYLALSHEDRELPWVIYLGIKA